MSKIFGTKKNSNKINKLDFVYYNPNTSNSYLTLLSIIGVDSSNYPTINSVLDSTECMNLINENDYSIQYIFDSTTVIIPIILNNSTYITTLLKNSNFLSKAVSNSTFLNLMCESSVSLTALISNSTALQSFLNTAMSLYYMCKSPTVAGLTTLITAIQSYRSVILTTLASASAYFTSGSVVVGNGVGGFSSGLNANNIYIPVGCNDDGDTSFIIKAGNNVNQIAYIPAHGGYASINSGVSFRGVYVNGSGGSQGNCTLTVYTAK